MACRNIQIVPCLNFSSASKRDKVFCIRSCYTEAQSCKISANVLGNIVCKMKCVKFVTASKACGTFRFLKYFLIMPFQKSLFMSSLSQFNSRGSCLYVCNYNRIWGVFSINELICSWIGSQRIKRLWIWSTTVLWAWKSEREKGKKGSAVVGERNILSPAHRRSRAVESMSTHGLTAPSPLQLYIENNRGKD